MDEEVRLQLLNKKLSGLPGADNPGFGNRRKTRSERVRKASTLQIQQGTHEIDQLPVAPGIRCRADHKIRGNPGQDGILSVGASELQKRGEMILFFKLLSYTASSNIILTIGGKQNERYL
jgi:hypothetical protein